MITDESESISHIGQDGQGVRQFASCILQFLLMGKVDLELLIRIRHRDMLVLKCR